MVMRGNCTFYEKVRLAQVNGARGLLIVSKERLVPPAGNRSQYEEIDIPVALLSYADMLDIGQRHQVSLGEMISPCTPAEDQLYSCNLQKLWAALVEKCIRISHIPVHVLQLLNLPHLTGRVAEERSFGRSAKVAMYAPGEPVLDYNMVIIFVMAVGTVAVGGYWAGSRDVKKRYMKHKRDDGAEKQEDETVDVTPVMIGVFVVMCCSMLVLLYYFYDQLVYAIIGIFCLAASIGLYSCLSPFVRRFPLGKCR
ncbi:hypothetical protein L345_15055, partial [Ophiophagus hannah]